MFNRLNDPLLSDNNAADLEQSLESLRETLGAGQGGETSPEYMRHNPCMTSMELLTNEITTLTFIQDCVEDNDHIPKDVIRLIQKQDTGLEETMPVLASCTDETDVNKRALLSEVYGGLEALGKAKKKSLTEAEGKAKRALTSELKAIVALGAVGVAFMGLITSLAILSEHVSRKYLPDAKEMLSLLDIVEKANIAMLKFIQGLDNAETLENKKAVHAAVKKFVSSIDGNLGIRYTNSGNLYMTDRTYETVTEQSLENAGFDSATVKKIGQKLKSVVSDQERRHLDLVEAFDNVTKHLKYAYNDQNRSNAEVYLLQENFGMIYDAITVVSHKTTRIIEDTEIYMHRVEKLVDKEKKQNNK